MMISARAESKDTEPKKMKVSELSIYDNPQDKFEIHVYDEKITTFKRSVTSVRKSVFNYLDSIKDTTDKIKDKIEIGKAHTQSTIEYVKSDPGILPRAGVITVAGLGGIVAGYKGGILRKIFLSTFAMTGAAALCYPNQAVEITTDGYNKIADHAKSLWQNPSKVEKPQSSELQEVGLLQESPLQMTISEEDWYLVMTTYHSDE